MMPHNTIETALYYIAIFPRKTFESTFRYEIWRKDGIIKTMSYQYLAEVGKAILIMYICASN